MCGSLVSIHDVSRSGDQVAVIDLRAQGREPKSGKRWETQWRDATRTKRTKRFATKKEAEDHDAAMRLESDRLRGNSVDDRLAKKLTVADLQQEYIEHLERYGGRGGAGTRASTLAGYTSQYDNWIAPGLGNLRLADLNREVIDQWRDSMRNVKGNEPAAATRAAVVRQASRLWTYGVERGLLRDNPSKSRSGKLVGGTKPKKRKEHVYLDPQQVWRLLAVARQIDQQTHDVIQTMVTTAMRFGELAALQAQDLDPDTGDLHIQRAYSSAGGKLRLEPPKTGEDRTVRVRGDVLEMLTERTSRLKRGDLIFAGSQGAPLRLDNWRDRKFYPVVHQARSVIERAQERLRVTEQRRGYAYWGPRTSAALDEARRLREQAKAGRFDERVRYEGGRIVIDGPQVPDLWVDVLKTVKPDTKSLANVIDAYTKHVVELQREIPLELLEGSTDFARLTPHDLRHTAISIAVSHGANVKVVQRLAGHASAKITLDTYAGLFEQDMEDIASGMMNALANPLAQA